MKKQQEDETPVTREETKEKAEDEKTGRREETV